MSGEQDAVTPGNATLVVAASYANKLTAFTSATSPTGALLLVATDCRRVDHQ